LTNQIFPTKGNLIKTKKSLDLSRMGHELLDRKRNILVREMMLLMNNANEIQLQIDAAYKKAYEALQQSNISLGFCDNIAQAVPVEENVSLSFRSVMGVELPIVMLAAQPPAMHYGFDASNSLLDEAYISFHEVKILTARLAEVENCVYRLAYAIKKTQKRVGALKNIMIPRFEGAVKFIADALEEKDREEFSRLKVIKSKKNQQED